MSNLRSERFGRRDHDFFFRKGVRAEDWAGALRLGEGGRKEGTKERAVQRGGAGVTKLHAAPGAQTASVVEVAR